MNLDAKFLDISKVPQRPQQFWPSIIVSKERIDAEIERLADEPRSASGRRESLVVHPYAKAPGFGLAPGIDVTISVLKPGEQNVPLGANSSRVDMCIQGTATAAIGEKTFGVEQHDVWNTPTMEPYSYRNDGNDLFVRLSYSNSPLLEKLEVHYVDENPKPQSREAVAEFAVKQQVAKRARDMAGSISLGDDGAQLLGYEYLIDIDVVDSKPLLWAWREVNQHLHKVSEMDKTYTGRHLYLLYNPATERRMGTTHSFFATIAKYPPGKVDRNHRHSSAAINYYFQGHGASEVMGERMEWKAGDLHLSAPGWAIHHHESREQGFCALTIQDHPLHLAMESLMWQESIETPIIKLGSQKGFETNLGSLVGV